MNDFDKSPAAGMSAPRGKTRRVISVCIILAVVTLAVFWQVKDHEFINFDDNLYVTENKQVRSGISLANLQWALTTSHTGYWHPLTWVTHMLDVQLFGMKAGWHHLMNVFLHVLNALLLFLILHRMTKALWQSAFVAALFALHPLHVESVAWTAERKDVLSTLFWMLSLGAYAHYVERPGYRRYLFVLGFFALALMSKPMVVTFPFVLLLLDYWPLGRFQPAQPDRGGSHNAVSPEKPARKKQKAASASPKNAVPAKEPAVHPLQWSLIWPLLREKAPLFLLSILSSVITFVNQQGGTSLQAIPPDARIANALVSYGTYLGKTIWPQNLDIF
jgi:protein O-mannosyl-transferase